MKGIKDYKWTVASLVLIVLANAVVTVFFIIHGCIDLALVSMGAFVACLVVMLVSLRLIYWRQRCIEAEKRADAYKESYQEVRGYFYKAAEINEQLCDGLAEIQQILTTKKKKS